MLYIPVKLLMSSLGMILGTVSEIYCSQAGPSHRAFMQGLWLLSITAEFLVLQSVLVMAVKQTSMSTSTQFQGYMPLPLFISVRLSWLSEK